MATDHRQFTIQREGKASKSTNNCNVNSKVNSNNNIPTLNSNNKKILPQKLLRVGYDVKLMDWEHVTQIKLLKHWMQMLEA